MSFYANQSDLNKSDIVQSFFQKVFNFIYMNVVRNLNSIHANSIKINLYTKLSKETIIEFNLFLVLK